MPTEGARKPNTLIMIKDSANSVFEVRREVRGAEIENVVTIQKVRNMRPKSRIIRLATRENGLATETIRRLEIFL